MRNLNLRILVIDEGGDDRTRDLLGKIQSINCDLKHVKSADGALPALLGQDRDVCLLDFRQNERDGLDILRQAASQGCRTPIIAIADDNHAEAEALRAGAADYLVRGSIDPPLLERAIHCVVQQKKVEKLTRANAVLAETDRRKDDFLAMLAHELRTPLAALAAAIELLKVDPPEIQENQRVCGVMQRQVQQLSHLVDDLRDVARIMRDKIHLDRKLVDLRGILRAAVEDVRPQTETHRHQVSLSLPEEPLSTMADAARLTQVFVNLLSNAAKFTADGGHIWVEAEIARTPAEDPVRRAEIVVRVRDSGIGMSAALVAQVFELFVQGRPSEDRTTGSLGIGLTLVRRLVRLHGGNVSAHSAGPGQGSEFAVRLPLAAAPAEEKTPAAVPSPPPNIPSRRVLMVDDNVDTAESLARLLRHLGQDVRTANDGPTALTVAAEFRPEIILLDIGLPGMSGHEVAAQLRGMPDMDKAVLVALSGYAQEEEGPRAREAGFHHYLIKPVSLKTLQTLLTDPHRPM